MEKLRFDNGVKSYRLGSCGVLRFNPSDPNLYARLMEAQKKGIRLALASARPSPGLFRERDALRLQDFGGILMSYNGGRIVDAATIK